MYALVAPMLVFGAGAAIDYGRAQQVQTKLNAAADAAALVAITPAMLQQSPAVAEAAAASMFKGLADSSGVSPGATKVRVTVSPSSSVLGRNVQVDYATSVDTIFAQVIGMERFPLSGHLPGGYADAPEHRPAVKAVVALGGALHERPGRLLASRLLIVGMRSAQPALGADAGFLALGNGAPFTRARSGFRDSRG